MCGMENSGNWILLLVGLLSSRCAASIVDKILELDGHRSAIYLSQKDGSEDGVNYIFEKINEKIGAYALLHYNHDSHFALIAKQALTYVIRSKVGENGTRANIDWKSFLETELMNIEKIFATLNRKGDKMDLTIVIVIVDGETVTTVESNPKNAKDRTITTNNLNQRYILLKAGFELDPNEEICLNKKLQSDQIWDEAAGTIIDLVEITHENKRKTKCTIIIDLVRVYPGFNGTVLLPTPIGFTVIEGELKLNGHRAAMCLLQKNDVSNNMIVHFLKKITDNIGAYGLIHYVNDHSIAVAARDLLENAIQSNIDKKGGAKVKWQALLEKSLHKMEKMVNKMLPKERPRSDISVGVVVVDKDIATQAKWFQKTLSERQKASNTRSTNIFCAQTGINKTVIVCGDSDFKVYSSKKSRYIRMLSDFILNRDELDRANNMFGRIKNLMDAPRGILNICNGRNNKLENSIGSIVIEFVSDK